LPEQPERWLLRAAAESVLPREIAQRPKLDLAQSTGTDLLLERYAESRITDRDFAGAAVRFPTDTPRSKEELLYRLIFDDLFPGEALRGMVARWRAPGTESWLS
jgi:asparagine synthase (glutamine-hydrolysing)